MISHEQRTAASLVNGLGAPISSGASMMARVTTSLVGELTVASGWNGLAAELNCWTADRRAPQFWWRDDDAATATASLDRLLAMRDKYAVPLALAVVPAHADRGLVSRLEGEADVHVLQHGWRHVDHARGGERSCEFAHWRSPGDVQAELTLGGRRLRALFGDRALNVLVPPYNRLASRFVPIVAEQYGFISVHGDFPGVAMPSRNTHADVVDWRTQRTIRLGALVRPLVMALRLRRYGILDAALPIGILSHHLAFDAHMWRMLDATLGRLIQHPCGSFIAATRVFHPHAYNH